MNYSKKFIVEPGSYVSLSNFDTKFEKKHLKKKSSKKETGKLKHKMHELQYRLFAEHKQSLLIILQAPDAGGKDGVVRHVIVSMNPQGCHVKGFKQPTLEELTHDFLWRIERQIPKPGEVVVFNRSHYEDVLIVRVHDLVPKEVWSNRYEQINDFEKHLIADGTHILKFFLHISKEEQLSRFKDRLKDHTKHWKISEADYKEREFWKSYQDAYEDVLSNCSSKDAPWFVIPSDQKWFRNLAISQIIVETMKKLDIEFPEPTIDIEDIRRKYHKAVNKGKKQKLKALK